MALFKRKQMFYDGFVELGERARKCMEALAEGLKDFENEDTLKLKNDVHLIEHEADKVKRKLEEDLAKEFVTPIDREDIFVLLDKLDDLIDAIDEVSYKIYIRNYKRLPEDIGPFIFKCIASIDGLNEVLKNFNHIHEKKIMDPLIDYVIKIEEEVDKLYEEKVRDLYLKEGSYDQKRMDERIYSYFENISDKSRDVCKEILVIMYKNI